jgi:hypothetical protein
MKQLIIYAGIIIMTVFGLTGCYKDIILPDAAIDPDAPPQAVSFKTDIAPMITSKCALSGCHVTGGHKPYMSMPGAYEQIVNGSYVNTLIPKQSLLYIKINGEMKEYIQSAADRQKIYDWIRNGAPNN